MPTPERILGAIIAGGASRRFGSDKALAVINGRPMLAHVVDAIRPQVSALVICGREWPNEQTLPDPSRVSVGPLGGLVAALEHAQRIGCAAVLSVPVDTLPLPGDLVERLRGNGPGVFDEQPLVGYWPIAFLQGLQDYLASGQRRVMGWVEQAPARLIPTPVNLMNVNSSADIIEFQEPTGG